MRQRSLGILGGVLLIGGIALGIATAIAANSQANANAANNPAVIHRPNAGGLPRHRGPGEPGPFPGVPGGRGGFPQPGSQTPSG
jgi:hypothetical protein